MDFKDEWDVESAMTVLNHQSVDSKTWAEAVEWLLLYGPPEVRELLLQASSTATQTHFPELHATGYTSDGEPCYDIKAVAKSLNISEEEAKEIISQKEMAHKMRHFIDKDEVWKVQ